MSIIVIAIIVICLIDSMLLYDTDHYLACPGNAHVSTYLTLVYPHYCLLGRFSSYPPRNTREKNAGYAIYGAGFYLKSLEP